MTLSTQPYKGARDFYPEDKRMQKYMFGILRQTVEKFGYEEYDAPILEPTELFASKTSDEIVNEQTYTFTDRGDRSVTIRTEMTPSVSRMVAGRRQELAYPVRWYSIPNMWRYERPQRGRLREFWQLNVDLFGVAGLEGDLEMLQVADAVMQAYGAKREMYEFRINSRKLMEQQIRAAGLKGEVNDVIRLIDQSEKISKEAFGVKLATLVDQPAAIEAYMRGDQASEEVEELLRLSQAGGISNISYAPTIARGFDYYTDIVFEIFDTDPNNNRSMFGGGRYDGLVGLFGVEPVPTVGFAMGDVTLQNFLDSHDLLPTLASETLLSVVLLGNVYEAAQKPIAELRASGVNVAIDSSGRKPDKQIKAAVKRGAPYVMFIGEKELADGIFVVKELATSQEEKQDIATIINFFQKLQKTAK